jgi:DNA mismatch repair protein MSH5
MYHEIDPSHIIHVGELIHQTVDFDQSKESNRTTVLQGLSAQLDELKRRYDGLEHFLSRVTSELIRKIPEWATEYIKFCAFFPQVGFLTAVCLNADTGKGLYDGEGLVGDVWEKMFVNEGLIYYKNRMMRDLDEQIGDLYCMIVGKPPSLHLAPVS